MTGKYGDLLKKARKKDTEAENNNESTSSNTAKQEAVKLVLQPAVNTESTSEIEIVKEKEVSLTIKVPISWRQHWVAECKREGKTLKEIVTEMLTDKYGKP
jgi:organic radical activating enzyme